MARQMTLAIYVPPKSVNRDKLARARREAKERGASLKLLRLDSLFPKNSLPHWAIAILTVRQEREGFKPESWVEEISSRLVGDERENFLKDVERLRAELGSFKTLVQFVQLFSNSQKKAFLLIEGFTKHDVEKTAKALPISPFAYLSLVEKWPIYVYVPFARAPYPLALAFVERINKISGGKLLNPSYLLATPARIRNENVSYIFPFEFHNLSFWTALASSARSLLLGAKHPFEGDASEPVHCRGDYTIVKYDPRKKPW